MKSPVWLHLKPLPFLGGPPLLDPFGAAPLTQTQPYRYPTVLYGLRPAHNLLINFPFVSNKQTTPRFPPRKPPRPGLSCARVCVYVCMCASIKLPSHPAEVDPPQKIRVYFCFFQKKKKERKIFPHLSTASKLPAPWYRGRGLISAF